jgi:hypothetical protein
MSKLRVDVKTKNFNELFKNAGYPIAIDSYQRPYVWDTKKLEQLLEDLQEFYKPETSDLKYYMGSILLHENTEDQKLYIIDGQQRLTSLCILHQVTTGNLPNNQELSYHSPKSVNNIFQAHQYFSEQLQNHNFDTLFEDIVFTVIKVNSQDLAFTFFDTQNNRGVPLKATDLLKAFHLRAIDGNEERLHLQKLCAKRWEGIQGQRKILGSGSDFAPVLFHKFLWRARNWKGKIIEYEKFNDVLNEFQQESIKEEKNNTFTLYASASNRWGKQLTLLPEDDYSVTPNAIRLSHFAADLPFAIRQPVSRGVGFFLYAQKYADLTQRLLHEEVSDPEIKNFRELYQKIYLGVSVYLRELFLLASAMYVDQFGTYKLHEFSLWLDYVLGAIRMEKTYIFKQAPVVFLRDKKRNLLDVIAGSFRAEEVIKYLKTDLHAKKIYDNEEINDDGVKKRYKDSVLKYFNKDGLSSLKGRELWIEGRIL